MRTINELRNGNVKFDVLLPGIKAQTARQAYMSICELAAPLCGVDVAMLYDRLTLSQVTQNNYIGDGIVVPCLKFSSLDRPYNILATLDRNSQAHMPLAANDGEPVDVICLILSPEAEGTVYLRRLARISRFLRNENLLRCLRSAGNVEGMTACLIAGDERSDTIAA